jgi:hypothetical protein
MRAACRTRMLRVWLAHWPRRQRSSKERSMQATNRPRYLSIDRLKIALVAAGVLAGSLVAVAAIDRGDDGAQVTGSDQFARVSASDAERRQLAMERDDFVQWQRSMIPYASPEQVAAEQRQLDMERADFELWQESMAPYEPLDDASDVAP